MSALSERSENRPYLRECLPGIVWSDSEEVYQRVKFTDVIHHRRSCETKSGQSLELTCTSRRERSLGLDALGFVEDNAVEKTLWAEQGEELGHLRLVVVILMTSLFLVIEPLLKSSEFCAQCSVCRHHNIVHAEPIPGKLLSRAMHHVDAQSVRGFDLHTDFSIPLSD